MKLGDFLGPHIQRIDIRVRKVGIWYHKCIPTRLTFYFILAARLQLLNAVQGKR